MSDTLDCVSLLVLPLVSCLTLVSSSINWGLQQLFQRAFMKINEATHIKRLTVSYTY